MRISERRAIWACREVYDDAGGYQFGTQRGGDRIAVAILPSLVDGDREVHDVVVVVDILHFGGPAQVPDNLHIV
jgi:hypothetical protein